MGKHLICWRARLIFRRTSTSWRKETIETSLNGSKANAKSCTEDSISTMQQYDLRWLRSSFAVNDMGDLTDNKMNMSSQCALPANVANSTLGWISKGVVSKSKRLLPFIKHLWAHGSTVPSFRIAEWLRLEGTSGGHPVQSACSSRVT